jgi:hypothetical protein
VVSFNGLAATIVIIIGKTVLSEPQPSIEDSIPL